MLEILATGSGLSLQDAGRAGWRRFGVPAGGAMDPRAMTLANQLLGNVATAPVLEIVLQGARLQVLADTWLALAGGDFCSRLASGSAQAFSSGDVLEFDRRAHGQYAYLAVPGGFQAQQWLGSAASDLRNGMGLAISIGSILSPSLPQPTVSVDAIARRISKLSQSYLPQEHAHFELYPGPQFALFSRTARQHFIEQIWQVSPRSDRTGYRLNGNPIAVPQSIASEPVLPGSFQVPGNGLPIVTMADGPTVGGYPKIAMLAVDDLARFAQCRAGTQLSFSWLD
jgi:biotin-dependent carboxylase-like uncharacterized protein